jgi:V/A-type H+-transporting ATPase subunit A
MERTVVIANTSNMPVAAREASIYSAITVAEYFRDQGLHVALMADSTSRWAEALREVSGRFGELPGEGGYPAYLSSRLADFYERAALVEPLAGGIGSVTVIGAISPPSGDFSEPVTSHTKRYVKTFWALDVKRAQARFYPAIHPLQSYAQDANAYVPWWTSQGNSQWLALRRRFLTLLDEEARLERMARIIGKDALPVRQQLTLLCADVVNEAFLRQSAFSEIDRVCAPARQSAMMRLIGRFIDLAEDAVRVGIHPQRIAAMTCMRPLQRMGEEVRDEELPRFAALEADMEYEFASLRSEAGANDAAHG